MTTLLLENEQVDDHVASVELTVKPIAISMIYVERTTRTKPDNRADLHHEKTCAEDTM